MNILIYIQETGRIRMPLGVSNARVADANTGPDEAWIEDDGQGDERLHYVVDGVRVDRPKVAPYAGGTAPLTLPMADLPDGSTFRATNNAGQAVETSDPADPITLETAGTYAVQIRPPFPHRDLDQEVTVSA